MTACSRKEFSFNRGDCSSRPILCELHLCNDVQYFPLASFSIVPTAINHGNNIMYVEGTYRSKQTSG